PSNHLSALSHPVLDPLVPHGIACRLELLRSGLVLRGGLSGCTEQVLLNRTERLAKFGLLLQNPARLLKLLHHLLGRVGLGIAIVAITRRLLRQFVQSLLNFFLLLCGLLSICPKLLEVVSQATALLVLHHAAGVIQATQGLQATILRTTGRRIATRVPHLL